MRITGAPAAHGWLSPPANEQALGMIAKLTGRVDTLEADRCVIDVGGVGYLVFASTRTLAALPRPPAFAQVLIETQVREDAIALYGFLDAAEREWFRMLTAVQGVGARLALHILSAFSPRELAVAIRGGDAKALTRAQGVGARLATRLVSELKNRAEALEIPAGGESALAPSPAFSKLEEDAVSVLINLGYRRGEAAPVLREVLQRLGPEAPLEDAIRACLRELAPKEMRK